MRGRLKGPHQLAGIGVQGHDAAGVLVIARARVSVQHRRRIPGPPVNEVEGGIIGPRHPGCAPGSHAGPRRRSDIPLPLDCAGLRINRLEEHGQVVHVAAHSHDDVIAHDERGLGRPVTFLHISQLDDPANLTVFGVERDQVCVRGDGKRSNLYRWQRRAGRYGRLCSAGRCSARACGPNARRSPRHCPAR